MTGIVTFATVIGRSVWFGTVFLFLTAAQHLCAQTVFSDGGVHNIATSVVGPMNVSQGSPGATTLNVLSGGFVTAGSVSGGNAYGIDAEAGGVLNLSGGTVSVGNVSGGRGAFGIEVEGGTVNINGGNVSVGNVLGGSGANAILTDHGTVNIYGGNIKGGNSSGGSGANGIKTTGGTVNIYSGNISGGNASSSGGGSAANAIIDNGGNINIYGGIISSGTADGGSGAVGILANGGQVCIFRTGFSSGFGPLSNWSGTLTGTLANGTPLNLTYSQGAIGDIVLFADGPAIIGIGNTVNGTIISGGTATLGTTVSNSAASGANNLNYTLTAALQSGSAILGPVTSGSGSLAPSASQSCTVSATCTTLGSNTISFTASDPNASNSQQTTTATLTVLGHAAPSLSLSTGNNQTVIVGATGITAGLNLSNGTLNQGGLASLDVNSLGFGVTGSTGGALVASGSAQSYTATLSTGTLGTQVESFSLNVGDDHTLSGASLPTNLSTSATLTVMDHSNASLSSTATQTTQTINFGNLLRGAAIPSQNFTIYNRAANTSAAYTANLKLTGSTANGDTALTTNLSTFNGLAAGSGTTCTASLNTSNYTTTGNHGPHHVRFPTGRRQRLQGAGSNNNGAITVTLQGNVGNATADASNSHTSFGSPLTAPGRPKCQLRQP